MKLRYLVKGLPGHPLHPPFTDATIGAYTVATVLGIASKVGISSHPASSGWWLAMVVALVATAGTATTGLVDWLEIERGTPLWRTATTHMLTMLTATGVFVAAVIWGHSGYNHGAVESGPFVLTLIGFAILTLGGWIGGSITYVHGMRVLNLVQEPAGRAMSPAPKPEKEMAEGG